jgi:hypothetical protein
MKELPASTIGNELIKRREGRPAASRLEFDPLTGELRLRPKDELPAPTDRAAIVDQIASDGFA